MMIDAELSVSRAQEVATPARSTHVIDSHGGLGLAVPGHLGSGGPVGFGLTVDVAAKGSAGNETYAIEIIESSEQAMGAYDVIDRFTFTSAQLSAGARWFLPLSPAASTQRYLALRYDTGGTAPAVTLSARLTPEREWEQVNSYAPGYLIS